MHKIKVGKEMYCDSCSSRYSDLKRLQKRWASLTSASAGPSMIEVVDDIRETQVPGNIDIMYDDPSMLYMWRL